MKFRDWLLGLVDRRPRVKETRARSRGQATHVIILDGTMSSLRPGRETNAGRTFKLIREGGLRANQTVYYEAGIQWQDWKSTPDVLMGRGINRQIERAYGVLASRYRPGDRIVLVGYSRGAYAVRSLAGVVDKVGLVQANHATVRNVRQAYRHYRAGGRRPAAEAFRQIYCHPDAEIEAVAVWDTVKSLGVRLPLLWKLGEAQHEFHNHALGPHVQHGFHALGDRRDAGRVRADPVGDAAGTCRPGRAGLVPRQPRRCRRPARRLRGGAAAGQYPAGLDAGPAGILRRGAAARLARAVRLRRCRRRRSSTWRGWGKIFVLRHRRRPGRDRSERLHESVGAHPLWPAVLPEPAPGPAPGPAPETPPFRPEFN